jgi:NAD(P)-dependent dehydrogenase (short-subunit alcohol dehydrogenase family)
MSKESRGVVFVAGGSGGIGSAVARRLGANGWHPVIAGRDRDRLDAVAREIGAEALAMDATDPGAVDSALGQVVDRHGRLDGLVNCVGSILLKPAHLTSDEDWATTVAVNLTSSFYLLRGAARIMGRAGGGAMVFCSSVAAGRGLPNHEAIAAAKAGIEGMVRAAASTYAKQKIRVNCVAPGLVRTPLSRSLTENEASLKASTSMHPLGRIGEPGDVASAIGWLMSEEQGWVTGQVIHVDGGIAAVQAR